VIDTKEKVEGGTMTLYKVFVPCGVSGVLPARVSGNKQNCGYL